MEKIKRIWQASGCRYGIRRGVWRGKGKITTKQRDDQEKPADLVKRNFTADSPNKRWVADCTYIKTQTGWVYTAFVIDVFKRVIVGWNVVVKYF